MRHALCSSGSNLTLRRIAAVATLGLVFTTSGVAQQRVDLANGWSPSPLEISQTPLYCQKQFLANHDPKVVNPLFVGCENMNHLCPGIVLINRAANPSIPKPERQRILRMAKGDIEYSMAKLTRQCVVYNDIMAARQQVQMLEMLLK